jgi:Flp pilus assembly pilin Flp
VADADAGSFDMLSSRQRCSKGFMNHVCQTVGNIAVVNDIRMSPRSMRLTRIASDTLGVAAIEYALIAAMIALGIVAAVGETGTALATTFSSVAMHLDGSGAFAPNPDGNGSGNGHGHGNGNGNANGHSNAGGNGKGKGIGNGG